MVLRPSLVYSSTRILSCPAWESSGSSALRCRCRSCQETPHTPLGSCSQTHGASRGFSLPKENSRGPQKPHQAVATPILSLMEEGDTGHISSHLPELLGAAPHAGSPSSAAANFLRGRSLVWGKALGKKIWFRRKALGKINSNSYHL